MPLLAITAGNWFETLWRQPRPATGTDRAATRVCGGDWAGMASHGGANRGGAGTSYYSRCNTTNIFGDNIRRTNYIAQLRFADFGRSRFATACDTLLVGRNTLIAPTPSLCIWPMRTLLGRHRAGRRHRRQRHVPTCWQDDAIVIDEHVIDVPPSITDGEYAIRVGLYDARDNTRLLLADGSDFVELGMVNNHADSTDGNLISRLELTANRYFESRCNAVNRDKRCTQRLRRRFPNHQARAQTARTNRSE